MAYTREEALNYLQDQFHEQAKDFAESGFLDDDTQLGWKGVLDRAFLAYGVSRSSLSTAYASDTDALSIEALLDYFALDSFLKRYAARVDEYTEHPSPDAKRSQAYKNTKDARDSALEKCRSLGYLRDATADRLVYLRPVSVDALEPEDTEVSS